MAKEEKYPRAIYDGHKGENEPIDLTFITNEPGKTLKGRFEQLIKDCQSLDCLVTYFYVSGFDAIYKPLQKTEKIRILIGIGTSEETYSLIKIAENQSQSSLQFSHSETKQIIGNYVENEMADSEDNKNVDEGAQKFMEWIKEGKLQIKAYPSQNIHAKLYIMTFKEGNRDVGRIITGSSNFTQSGLVDNLEFNVELKNRSDYEFAKWKFEELWKDAVDVSEKYIETLNKRTWLNQNIIPYELYLKFLYEYFQDELSRTDEIFTKYLPEEFKRFEYQEQAVLNAKMAEHPTWYPPFMKSCTKSSKITGGRLNTCGEILLPLSSSISIGVLPPLVSVLPFKVEVELVGICLCKKFYLVPVILNIIKLILYHPMKTLYITLPGLRTRWNTSMTRPKCL